MGIFYIDLGCHPWSKVITQLCGFWCRETKDSLAHFRFLCQNPFRAPTSSSRLDGFCKGSCLEDSFALVVNCFLYRRRAFRKKSSMPWMESKDNARWNAAKANATWVTDFSWRFCLISSFLKHRNIFFCLFCCLSWNKKRANTSKACSYKVIGSFEKTLVSDSIFLYSNSELF